MIIPKIVDIGFDKLDTIFHVSDVHIRNFKRHDEYRRVFESLNFYLKEKAKHNFVTIITGDIVHSKTDVSPELVQEVQHFLKLMSEVGHVIVTAGNHDTNLNNNHRLDTLTPIINAISSDRIHYLRDTGVYKIADKHLFVWSVFDSLKDYPKAYDYDCEYKIATYHGPVTNAVTEANFKLTHENISVNDFDGFDIVLLGDIHKRQYLNEKKTIAYPGSLIQQNHAESLNHGIMEWDLVKGVSDFINIPNDTCFYTVNVDAGKYDPIPDYLPKKMFLRVRHKNTPQSELKQIIAEIKSNYEVVESSIQRVNDVNNSSPEARKLSVLDVRDVDYQNKMLSSYLKDKYNLGEDAIKEVCEINKTCNNNLQKIEFQRNVLWIPKSFQFENMFSYGKGNFIDFENMQGTYGIFASNASGKSTLLDSVMYCVFDKCSKTSKGVQVMNNQSNNFRCKLIFELDGTEYGIERIATRQKSGNVKVDVDFWKKDSEGNLISLNGKERNETNSNIRNLLGTYEDFVLTSLSTQNSNTGFIDMNQKDRKDLLSQFLDINVFEDLYNIANTEMKEVSILLKEYQKEDYFTEILKCRVKIEELDEQINQIKSNKSVLELKKSQVNNKLIEESSKLIKVDNTIVDIDDLNSKKKKIEENSSEIEKQIDKKKQIIDEISASYESISGELEKIDRQDLENNLKLSKEYYQSFQRLKTESLLKEKHLKLEEEKLEKLKDLKYDPNCKFCMENVFVKDAIHTSSSFCDNKKQLEELKNELFLVENQVSGSIIYEDTKSKVQRLEDKKKDAHNQKLLESVNLQKLESKLKDNLNYLKDLEKKIEDHFKQESSIELNKTIQGTILSIKEELKDVENKLSEAQDELLDLVSSRKTSESNMKRYQASTDKLKSLESKFKNYQYYLDATHRDGVPHSIISSVIPKIEEEINNILGQLVDFSIVLQTDDKNINAYIAYDDKRFWPIELTSGMEKFVSSLAIRTSLINISTLPRPNFLAIDEGFGALDKNNLSSMSMFFDYLKTQFKFIIIVSHIETMRDIVDKHIEIHKFNGRSKIEQFG